jgi:PAS domain S-box-containing protein
LDGVFHNMAVERNQVEKLIKQNEHRVRSILEEMPVALMVTDEAGHIEATNIRADDMLGHPGGTLIGSQVGALFSSEGKEASSFMTEIVPKAFGQSQELSVHRKDGKDLPIELSVSRLEMMDGPRLLVTMLDITQRREIERLKQEFVNMISHDLKTPLTSIVGNLALVAADAFGPLSERGKQIVDASEKQTMRLINMINDLLLLEKMDAGGFELHRTRVDVCDVVEQSIEAVGKLARDHSVTVEAAKTEAFIDADGMRLQQVLVNLLTNAIKYSPANEVVKLDIEDSPDCLTFRVIDKGRGIPEEYRQSIFEQFKQVEASDFREKGGTGLGLPICKVIVEKHGGKIGVDSDPGEGSTFWFRLPKN